MNNITTDYNKMMNLENGLEEKILEIENKDELGIEKAIRIQRKISNILVEENVTLGAACNILYAFTESIYHYMMFGSSENIE